MGTPHRTANTGLKISDLKNIAALEYIAARIFHRSIIIAILWTGAS
jgi:hypothetical protein